MRNIYFLLMLLVLSTSAYAQEKAVAPTEDLPWLPHEDKVKEPKKAASEVIIATINYYETQIDVPSEFIGEVDKIISSMNKKAEMRINIKSYASKREGRESEARRISLKRALSIRKYITGRGIEAVRIVINAYGDKFDDKASDQVKIFKI